MSAKIHAGNWRTYKGNAPTLFLIGLAVLGTTSARAILSYTTLFSFASTNGSVPIGTLLQGTNGGDLYGATLSGGTFNKGTVFKFSTSGTFTLLTSLDDTNGSAPHDGLCQASDGNFYGTAGRGGAYGKGSVFKVSPEGSLSPLVSFEGTNGASPMAEVIQAADGNLYGTTSDGGPYKDSYGFGYGTVFQLSLAGLLNTLFWFDNTNGAQPWAPLLRGNDGSLYGMCREGGAAQYAGTAFKISTNGGLVTLVSFDPSHVGAGSLFGFIQGKDGNFYGTTYVGTNHDTNGNYFGNVIRMTPEGVLTTLFDFNGTNGALPRSIVQARDGNFYGMCGLGGIGYHGQLYSSGGHGTLFQITPAGDFTNLVLFTGDESPFNGLVQASDGNLYGMTRGGGANDSGTIFRLSVPMQPVFQSVSKVGGQIALSWSSVAGQKYQLQYSSDLSPTSWTNLTEMITASDGITTAEDDSGLNPLQRFYRVVLLP